MSDLKVTSGTNTLTFSDWTTTDTTGKVRWEDYYISDNSMYDGFGDLKHLYKDTLIYNGPDLVPSAYKEENNMAKDTQNTLYKYTLIAYNDAYSEKPLHEKRILLDISGIIEVTSDNTHSVTKRVEMKHYKELSSLKNIDDVVINITTSSIGRTKGKPD